MASTLQGEALVVHLFVAANGLDRQADHTYLLDIWLRLRDEFGLTESIVGGLRTDPKLDDPPGLLAGLRHPGAAAPHVQEALLRREHDTFCLSVMREPAESTWVRLQEEWDRAMGELVPSPGVLGTAHVFLARLPDPVPDTGIGAGDRPDPDLLGPVVRDHLPTADPASGSPASGSPRPRPTVRWRPGVAVSRGFAVWEASEPADERAERRLVVVAPADADHRLSAWTWVVGAERELPELGRYLMHAATLRHQLRVWTAERAGLRELRGSADASVDRLLGLVASEPGGGPTADRLLAAAREIAELQASERGLVRTATAVIEMQRTVAATTANLTVLADPGAGGLFAEDRALGTWFGQQLDDEAVYLGSARERAGQVAALTDQLLRRRAQDERERFNLALTGAIGAILMVLAASQSFGYTPPLPQLVQPAVVALLGALALLSTLAMLWIVGRGMWWSRVLLWAGWGLVAATGTWVVVSARMGAAATESTTRWWALAGFAAGSAIAALWHAVAVRRRRRRRRSVTPAA
jgi:hypothetical protein